MKHCPFSFHSQTSVHQKRISKRLSLSNIDNLGSPLSITNSGSACNKFVASNSSSLRKSLKRRCTFDTLSHLSQHSTPITDQSFFQKLIRWRHQSVPKIRLNFDSLFDDALFSDENEDNAKHILLSDQFCQSFLKEMEASQLKSLTVGRGSFGRVFSSTQDDFKIAIKICPKAVCGCRGEFNLLKLNHLNVVKVFKIIELSPSELGLHFSDTYLSKFNRVSRFKLYGLQMILMSHAGSHSLADLIDSQGDIDKSRRNYFLQQIASALSYCHSRLVVHLDLKPANIMISDNDVCKLIDFGCSQSLCETHKHTSLIKEKELPGSVSYTAPEIFKGHKPTTKCDIYSYGIIMWQLVSRETPYKNYDSQYIIHNVS